MRNSGKPYCFLPKKAKQKQARRKRLKLQRIKMGNLTPVGREVRGRRQTSFNEIPVSESQNVSTKYSDIAADLRPANLQSDSGSGLPESGDAGEGVLANSNIVCRVKKESDSLDYLLSYGIASVIGRRRAMEDAVAVEMGVGGREFSYFAVFDGHGGSAVANACSNRLQKLLAYEIEGNCLGFDWGKIMRVCFKKMDEEVNECVFGGVGPAKVIGSTAVVVVVGKEEIVVANCGNSRVIMCRGGIPVALSHDHKPDRPDERVRIEAAGGRIINSNGSHIMGVMAISRSIGDEYLKPYVISEPEVTVSKRTRADNFLIIASDGLWDVVPKELACDVVKPCLTGRIRKKKLTEEGNAVSCDAAAILAALAMAKGSKDNISVIVVELEKKSSLVDAS